MTLNRKKRLVLAAIAWLLVVTAMVAQPSYRIIDYAKLNDGVTTVHRIVRDNHGMMWFATDDGLYRYDGYQFVNFKSHSGDGVNMPSNRINSMYASSGGGIWCLVSGRPFLFDTSTSQFVDVLSDFEQKQGKNYHIRRLRPLACGMTWLFAEDGTIMVLEDERPQRSVRLIADHERPDDVTVLCDSIGRSWVLTARHTYLYKKGNLKRFDQTYRRIVANGRHVWLLDGNGRLARYDEQKQQIMPWIALQRHTLKERTPHSGQRSENQLTTDVVSMSMLSDGTMALSDKNGLLLVSADGNTVTRTQVTWPVQKVMEDGVGRLWLLATDGTMSVVDRQCQQVSAVVGIYSKDKCDIMRDKHGTVWLFTASGDTYYATATDPTHPVRYTGSDMQVNISNTIEDGQGGYWFIHKYHAYRLTFESPHYRKLPLHQADQVRCVVTDGLGHVLVATRYDESVAVFRPDGTRLGWLGRDGRMHTEWTPFGRAVYGGLLASDGTLWLGTKRDGLLRLRPQSEGSFEVSTYNKDNGISDNEIYDLAEDSRHRLWIATHKGGLCCIEDCRAATPKFLTPSNGLTGWQQDRNSSLRALLVTPENRLLVGTFNGLFVADISSKDLHKMTFKQHQRESLRKTSLSSSSISDILRTGDGRILLSTSDGGINELLTKNEMPHSDQRSENVTASQLEFKHYNRSTGFPVDIVHAIIEYDGALWAVAPDQLLELQLNTTDQPNVNTFLMRERPRFASCRPAEIDKGKWVFGSEDGAMLIDLNELKNSPFVPPLLITGISKENSPINYSVIWNDTIVMSPQERDLTVWFAALDYENTELVAYAYRMGDSKQWTYIGQNHSITLAQMQPGQYQMTIRSTNSNGTWCDNERTLTIIVTPTFWETPWAKLLILTIIVLLGAIITYTVLYIRRIKRTQHETMEAYLALLEVSGEKQEARLHCNATLSKRERHTLTTGQRSEWLEVGGDEPEEVEPSEDDLLMKRVVAYMEENLKNSDLTIDDIAQAVAVSRTSLHRKMKQMMGTSPMEFLREARIRKAAKMLTATEKNVSEIAYQCGFSDPKYFSKCFKNVYGQTPTDYKVHLSDEI